MEVRVICLEENPGRPEKLIKSVALLLHFITDLQAVFQLFFNNINRLSRI